MQGLNKELIDEHCIDVIRDISDAQYEKIKSFCDISNHHFMVFGTFTDDLNAIRTGTALIEKQKALACYVLMQLLIIQGCIDDFDPIDVCLL